MTAKCATCNVGIKYITKATKYCELCKKKMRTKRRTGYTADAKVAREVEGKSKTIIHPMFLSRHYKEDTL